MSCFHRRFVNVLSEYETTRYVSVKNYTVAIINRVAQLFIFIYIVCWIFLYEKSYQITDDAVSSTYTKVKGVGFSDFNSSSFHGKRVWDIYDLQVPALEENALFITTNVVVTQNQTLSKCPQSYNVKAARCSADVDCIEGHLDHFGNGVFTGKCVKLLGRNDGTCEVYSWCPLENDTLPLGAGVPMFPMIVNFTVFIKAQVVFPEFEISRRNILDWINKDYLRKCHFNRSDEKRKYCPIFKISTILDEAEVDFSILRRGGIIGIYIDWDCDLDWSPEYCKPTYSFIRLHGKSTATSPGFNYRYVRYHMDKGTMYRDLYKVYGIRFIIQARGRAGKFHLLPFTLSLGSGVGWVSLASVVCDLILTKCLKAADFYENITVERISKEDEAEYVRNLLLKKMDQNRGEKNAAKNERQSNQEQYK